MHPFRFSRLWLTLGYILVTLVVFLSLWPKPPQPLDFEQSDKVAHIFTYMVLMLWFVNLYSERSRQVKLGVVFLGMGVFLELLQGMSEYRTLAYTDMLANGVGILVGLYLAKTRLAFGLLYLDTRLSRQ